MALINGFSLYEILKSRFLDLIPSGTCGGCGFRRLLLVRHQASSLVLETSDVVTICIYICVITIAVMECMKISVFHKGLTFFNYRC
jgi:hypothetical protein